MTGSVTSNDSPALVRGRLGPAEGQAAMRINARVRITLDELRAIVEGSLRRTSKERSEATITALGGFRPGRPVPTHRFTAKQE